MQTRLIALVVFVAAVLVPGCATQPPRALDTPTGRPEITIQGATKKQVADAIVTGALERGSQVKSVTEYEVLLTRRIDGNFAASLLFGSRYDTVPEARMHLNMVEVPGGVRVFGRAEMITNPGSAFERVSDITEGAKHELQASLMRLASRFPASSTAPAAAAPAAAPTATAPATMAQPIPASASRPPPIGAPTGPTCRWLSQFTWGCT